eukprot:g68584.t1
MSTPQAQPASASVDAAARWTVFCTQAQLKPESIKALEENDCANLESITGLDNESLKGLGLTLGEIGRIKTFLTSYSPAKKDTDLLAASMSGHGMSSPLSPQPLLSANLLDSSMSGQEISSPSVQQMVENPVAEILSEPKDMTKAERLVKNYPYITVQPLVENTCGFRLLQAARCCIRIGACLDWLNPCIYHPAIICTSPLMLCKCFTCCTIGWCTGCCFPIKRGITKVTFSTEPHNASPAETVIGIKRKEADGSVPSSGGLGEDDTLYFRVGGTHASPVMDTKVIKDQKEQVMVLADMNGVSMAEFPVVVQKDDWDFCSWWTVNTGKGYGKDVMMMREGCCMCATQCATEGDYVTLLPVPGKENAIFMGGRTLCSELNETCEICGNICGCCMGEDLMDGLDLDGLAVAATREKFDALKNEAGSGQGEAIAGVNLVKKNSGKPKYLKYGKAIQIKMAESNQETRAYALLYAQIMVNRRGFMDLTRDV